MFPPVFSLSQTPDSALWNSILRIGGRHDCTVREGRISSNSCSLVLSFANSKQKDIKGNIKISNAILSRFDLIFLMLDKPDPNRDQKLSEHIMKLHKN